MNPEENDYMETIELQMREIVARTAKIQDLEKEIKEYKQLAEKKGTA